jgi:hypothetical protein
VPPEVNWEKLRTQKIFLASPIYGNMLHFGFYQSVIQLALSCQRSGVGFGVKHVGCDSLVPRARNRLVAFFLRSNATDLLFVDSDISFTVEDALSLIQMDEPIIGGVYPRKQLDWERIRKAAMSGIGAEQLPYYGYIPVMNWGDQGDYSLDSLMEVRHLGTGFLRIKREVFKEMIRREAALPYDYSSDESVFSEEPGYDFFPIGPDVRYPLGSGGRQYLSEDWAMCEMARQCGYKLFAAPWVRLTHSGYMDYTGSLEVMDAGIEEKLNGHCASSIK